MTTTTFIEASHPEVAAERNQARREQRNSRRDLGAELVGVARLIEAARAEAEESQNAWVRKWPGLGSQKSYAKIIGGDLADISLEKKLPDYRAVLAAICANVGASGAEPLYADLPGPEALLLTALRLMHHEGKDRLILLLGGSGSGKTSALDVLAAEGGSGSKLLRLEADETWKSPRAALRRMLIAAGVPKGEVPNTLADMEDLLIGRIQDSGRCMMVVDEAHHVSGCVLNLFKTLLNRTQLRLILAGMNTLFQKLRANASEEAKQLIHNRLFQRVDLSGPDKDTARLFLSRRLGADPGWKNGTMFHIASAAASSGHWSFLRRVIDQVRASGIAAPGDAELIAAADAARKEIA